MILNNRQDAKFLRFRTGQDDSATNGSRIVHGFNGFYGFFQKLPDADFRRFTQIIFFEPSPKNLLDLLNLFRKCQRIQRMKRIEKKKSVKIRLIR